MQHRSYTLPQIKQADADAGLHWFSKGAMRFFATRLLSTTYGPDSNGLVYFVTSEEGPSEIRLYTVRAFDPRTSMVQTHGDFQGYATAAKAQGAARRAARL